MLLTSIYCGDWCVCLSRDAGVYSGVNDFESLTSGVYSGLDSPRDVPLVTDNHFSIKDTRIVHVIVILRRQLMVLNYKRRKWTLS